MSEQEFFCLCIPANLLKLDMLISRRPEVFLISSKFTGEHPCRIVISIKLLCNFIEITLRRGCSLVHLLHIFRTPFLKSTSEWLLPNHVHLCIFFHALEMTTKRVYIITSVSWVTTICSNILTFKISHVNPREVSLSIFVLLVIG